MNLTTHDADQGAGAGGLTVRPVLAGHFDDAYMHRKCYASKMKSTTLPPVRVEPEFRAAAESVLHEGESLTGFIEATVRRAVEYRRVQAEFHARGQAAWEEIQRGGVTHSAEDVLARLREMTAARRDKLQTR